MTITLGVGGANHQVSAISEGVASANHAVKKGTLAAAGANHDYFGTATWKVAASPQGNSTGTMSAGTSKNFAFGYSIIDPDGNCAYPVTVTFSGAVQAGGAGMSGVDHGDGSCTITSTQAGVIYYGVDVTATDANGVSSNSGSNGTSGLKKITAS